VGRFFRLRALREELGQSLVELALLLPILVFGLIGGADLARAFALQLAVQNGARAGAEAYAINQSPSAQLAKNRTLDEMGRTPGFTINPVTGRVDATVTVIIAEADGATACISPPTIAEPCFVTVNVQYQFKTIIPWPLIPNVANFNRQTTMRTFY
jgi:Flp pilus assembly protein TadG